MAQDTPRALYVLLLAATVFLAAVAVGNSARADDGQPIVGIISGGEHDSANAYRDRIAADAALHGSGLISIVYGGGVPELPDPAKTPGAVATTDKAEICGRVNGLTYTKRHRVWHNLQQTFAKYGVPWAQHHDYEDDDRVPVCAGGDNANPLNHWPQPSDKIAAGGWGYETKDWLDAESCRIICSGKASPEEVQGWFLEPDYRRAYCEQRPSDPKCAGFKP